MGFQPGGREMFRKFAQMLKFTNVQVRTCSNYPHLNNFTLHCTYITHALKYIEPVLGHIVHVPKSTHVQCTRNICEVCFQRIRNDL